MFQHLSVENSMVQPTHTLVGTLLIQEALATKHRGLVPLQQLSLANSVFLEPFSGTSPQSNLMLTSLSICMLVFHFPFHFSCLSPALYS